jgi:hypothetical protein
LWAWPCSNPGHDDCAAGKALNCSSALPLPRSRRHTPRAPPQTPQEALAWPNASSPSLGPRRSLVKPAPGSKQPQILCAFGFGLRRVLRLPQRLKLPHCRRLVPRVMIVGIGRRRSARRALQSSCRRSAAETVSGGQHFTKRSSRSSPSTHIPRGQYRASRSSTITPTAVSNRV